MKQSGQWQPNSCGSIAAKKGKMRYKKLWGDFKLEKEL